MSITESDRRPIKQLLAKTRREMSPVLKRLREEQPDLPEHTESLMVAQNALRVCLETVLRASLPYDPTFLSDLGARLAAYCITAGPPDAQDLLVEHVQELLPVTVAMKQQGGTGIKADWVKPSEMN